MDNKSRIDNLIIESILLMGEDIRFNGFNLRHYKLKDIYGDKIGILNYYVFIHMCLEPVESYFGKSNKFKDLESFLNVFTDSTWVYDKHLDSYVGQRENRERPEEVFLLKQDDLSQLFKIYKKMYYVEETKKDSEREGLSDDLKEILKEFDKEEEKIRIAKGCLVTTESIIKNLSCKHPSINLLNVWNYTIYQLMISYQSINRIDEENRVLGAIYSGTLDSKDIDIQKHHWANEGIK